MKTGYEVRFHGQTKINPRPTFVLLLSIIELLTIRNIQWPLDMDHVRNNLLSFLKKGTGRFQKIIFICNFRIFRETDKKNFFKSCNSFPFPELKILQNRDPPSTVQHEI